MCSIRPPAGRWSRGTPNWRRSAGSGAPRASAAACCAGAAGVGKTRLAEEYLARAARDGYRTGRARATASSRHGAAGRDRPPHTGDGRPVRPGRGIPAGGRRARRPGPGPPLGLPRRRPAPAGRHLRGAAAAAAGDADGTADRHRPERRTGQRGGAGPVCRGRGPRQRAGRAGPRAGRRGPGGGAGRPGGPPYGPRPARRVGRKRALPARAGDRRPGRGDPGGRRADLGAEPQQARRHAETGRADGGTAVRRGPGRPAGTGTAGPVRHAVARRRAGGGPARGAGRPGGRRARRGRHRPAAHHRGVPAPALRRGGQGGVTGPAPPCPAAGADRARRGVRRPCGARTC